MKPKFSSPFTIYPAIDLRNGQVVRLAQGDLTRQTIYSSDPAEVAARWCAAGAAWLHVVNLDGAFDQADTANMQALKAILQTAAAYHVKVQFGGGIRTMTDLGRILQLGVDRAILGTAVVENPDMAAQAIAQFGSDSIGAGLDVRDGKVRVRGWTQGSEITAVKLGTTLYQMGVRTAVFTNIARDGVGSGVDVTASRALAEATNLNVIASGGVASQSDIEQVKAAGLSGVIVGRALYEGHISLQDSL
ncbi:MAG: 1-(5-phosphoribosyl)-5-[(5-phosphoribosylamino)methylideneamino]imidazole-4-carboxamide isomerase [Candidatus Promineifilaceae bacterium]